MTITINGKQHDIAEDTRLTDLLAQRDVAPQQVVVEINREILPRERFAERVLQSGDQLEILRFVGGG